MELFQFDQVTLLITHYNRSSSLRRLLLAFQNLKMKFGEIVVSDDGSFPEHLEQLYQLKEEFSLKLILTDKNRGLAHNLNKGQRSVSLPYTLYVQEDFIPGPLAAQRIKNGIEIMAGNPRVDLVRFYAYRKYPYLRPLEKGFSEMKFNFWKPGFWQFWCYSDHPHLRRSSFLQKFGDYQEGISSDRAEFRMAISFLQKEGIALIHEDYQHTFLQRNSELEPSRVARKKFRKYIQLTNFFLIKFIRTIYRNIKFRIDYLFL
jgi:glycosyltransferase involved in cell wall biosynthesis